jgi:hypothetical protein
MEGPVTGIWAGLSWEIFCPFVSKGAIVPAAMTDNTECEPPALVSAGCESLLHRDNVMGQRLRNAIASLRLISLNCSWTFIHNSSVGDDGRAWYLYQVPTSVGTQVGETNSMKNFAYILAALVAVAFAMPSIASAKEKMMKHHHVHHHMHHHMHHHHHTMGKKM